jgi:hypothetical protein
VSATSKKKSLLVFAGAALSLVCGVYLLSQISASAAWYAMLTGVACYLLFSTAFAANTVARARLGWRQRTLRFVAAVCLQTIAAVLLFALADVSLRLATAVQWDPQGEASDSSMFDGSDCSISDLASVSNSKGNSAAARHAVCGWGPWAGMSYGYIVVAITRSRGTEKNREVVLRYEPTTSERRAWPKMKWLSDDILSVIVGNNAIEQVSKQRFDLEGLHVRYSLGAAKKPPMTLWERF